MKSEEFIFETFDEAMDIHKKIFKLLRQNGFVTLADLHYLINEEEDLPEDFYIYGWTSLIYAKIDPYYGRWVITMPKMEKLENKKKLIK